MQCYTFELYIDGINRLEGYGNLKQIEREFQLKTDKFCFKLP